MRIDNFTVVCPNCHLAISEPFVRELEAQAIEEYDMAEISAQEALDDIQEWFTDASLWTLITFWFEKRWGR